MKRLFDFLGASILLVVLSPLFLLIAVLIKLDSGGPVLYSPERTGRHGKPLRYYKFRTMIVGADKLGGSVTAKNDPRITRVGKFLRKYKLDELPQLVNIVKGEMSFVGPRPEMPEYTRLYTEEEKIILSVRPGMTDYAIVEFIDLGEVVGTDNADEAYRAKVLPEKNWLRIKYVQEQTFWGDIKIIWKTFLRIVRQ